MRVEDFRLRDQRTRLLKTRTILVIILVLNSVYTVRATSINVNEQESQENNIAPFSITVDPENLTVKTGEYFNITIGLVVTLVVYVVAIGISVTDADMGPGPRWLGPAIGFVWLVLLIVWFYLFASGFNDYQNFAVVILSIILMAAIGGLIGRNKWGGIDSFDWRD